MMIIKFISLSLSLRHFLLLMVVLAIQPCVAADDVNEQKIIEKNSNQAQQSAQQAMFKVYRIRCFNTSDGKKALKACQQALAIDASDASIKKKKAELMTALKPPAPKPRPQPVQVVQPVSKPESMPIVAEKEPLDKTIEREQEKAQQQETEIVKTVKQDNKKEEREKKKEKEKEKEKSREDAEKRKIVKQVQQKLNQLGFKVGTADGVAGKKTRQAIRRFQKLTKRSTKTTINRKLLADLKEAHIEHKVASELHKVAMEQQQAGRLESALGTVKKGLKKAPWHQPLKTLRGKVRQQVAAQEQDKKDAEAKKMAAQLAKDKSEDTTASQDKKPKKSSQSAVDKEEETIASQDKKPKAGKEAESTMKDKDVDDKTNKVAEIQPNKPEAKQASATQKGSSAEQQKLLESIAAKQKKIANIDINLSMEQLVLMSDAQRSLEKFADK